MALVTLSSPEMTFLEILPILRFRFDTIAQNENPKSAEIFRFSVSSGDFYHNARSDIILILETLEWVSLRCFSTKSFQDSSINHLPCLRKSLLPHILARNSKLNDFIINFVLGCRAKTKTRNWRNFWKRLIQEKSK